MKLNDKLLAQMRAATRTLSGKGPQAATAAIHDALKILSPGGGAARSPAPQQQPLMRDINPAPGAASAGSVPPPTETPAEAARSPMQDMNDTLNAMLGKLQNGKGLGDAFAGMKMPDFDLPGKRKAASNLPGKFIDASFTNGAGTRSYKLYIPSTHTGQPAPLVVMLHGCTQDPDDFATGTQMNELAEEMGCLVVYPAQSQQANSSRCWNWFSAVDQKRGQGEPSIIAGITEAVMHEHAVQRSEVYVAGLSAGGAMATIMGTLYPDLYAAVGVHSGLPFAAAHDLPSALAAMKGNFGRSTPSAKAIPIIVFHGDKDTTVHPANGAELIKQGVHQVGKDIKVEPGRVPDGHAYTRTVHHRADGAPHAEHWNIHGAGHAWSGGSANGSYTDGKGPDASREMMRFFQTKR
ncbi:MAG: PHB depolymerase family esterase [Pseudomonadota bacterium]